MTAGVPLWVAILVALGIPTLLVAAVGSIFKLLQLWRERKADRANRQIDRQENREDRREDRNETWNDQVRTNIENHIPWDAKVLAHVQRIELLVNDLREGQGKPAVAFPPLGDPPALFPAGKAPPRDDS